MAPIVEHCGAFGVRLEPIARCVGGDTTPLLRSFQRALMACARDDEGRIGLEGDPQVYLAADMRMQRRSDWVARIVVAAPWVADRTRVPHGREGQRFDAVVRNLRDFRAGPMGAFSLDAAPLVDGDPMIGPSAYWESVTPYLPIRRGTPGEHPRTVLIDDMFAQWERRGIPEPERVGLSEFSWESGGGGPWACLRLYFPAEVRGPLLLGRDGHLGRGLFYAVPPDEARNSRWRERAWRELRAVMAEIGKEATRRGLTDAELERLLADDS